MSDRSTNAIHELTPCMFALPVYGDDAQTLGFVRVSGSRWGSYDTAGRLLGLAHSEHAARCLVVANSAILACSS